MLKRLTTVVTSGRDAFARIEEVGYFPVIIELSLGEGHVRWRLYGAEDLERHRKVLNPLATVRVVWE